jgi:Protein of unknown function (DUF4236)
MGMKFRRKQKLFPGVYLNFSAKGISTTIGPKGFNVNIGQNGTYLNTGISGTGIYDRHKISNFGTSTSGQKSNSTTLNNSDNIIENDQYYFYPKKTVGEIKSDAANSITSQGLLAVKETLIEAHNEKSDIEKEIIQIEKDVEKSAKLKLFSQIGLIGFFTDKFKNKYDSDKIYLENLKNQLINCKVDIDINIDKTLVSKYEILMRKFEDLTNCYKIWDQTSSIDDTSKSLAQKSITRIITSLYYNKIKFINADFDALYFKNQNGSDIYLYPAFAVFFDDKDNFGLVDLKDLDINFNPVKFLEEEDVPHDTDIIGETWAKVNKNGLPDMRFQNNYTIPIVHYGELQFKSPSGINEAFTFSNMSKAQDFSEAYKSYINENYKPTFSNGLNYGKRTNVTKYVSNKQIVNFYEDESDITLKDQRILEFGDEFYKIELPTGEIIAGMMIAGAVENGRKIYHTELGCPISIGEDDIFINLGITHNCAFTFIL